VLTTAVILAMVRPLEIAVLRVQWIGESLARSAAALSAT
jgi:hypothetical protein